LVEVDVTHSKDCVFGSLPSGTFFMQIQFGPISMLCYPANGRVDDYCGQSAYEILNYKFVLYKIETFSYQDPHPTIKNTLFKSLFNKWKLKENTNLLLTSI
jgi:hypothetical protein